MSLLVFRCAIAPEKGLHEGASAARETNISFGYIDYTTTLTSSDPVSATS